MKRHTRSYPYLSHLQAAFCHWLTAWYSTDEEVVVETVELDGRRYRVQWLFKQLWHCPADMPSDAVRLIEDNAPPWDREPLKDSSYASGVRAMVCRVREEAERARRLQEETAAA